MLNETNIKWIPSNLDKMEREFKKISREIKVIGNNSNEWK